MDSQTFSRELCAWIDPLEIIKAGIRYDIDIQKAITPTKVLFTSQLLSSAEDGIFYDLVEEFLKNFRIPMKILKLLQAISISDDLSNDSWNWLTHLKFEGNINKVNYDDDHFLEGTILMIYERDIVADIITQPIRVLVNVVGNMCNTWKEMKQLNMENPFLYHSSPDSLGVYIESRISQYYGFRDAVTAGVQYESVANLRYRAITILGTPPIKKKSMETAKNQAHFLATQTLR